MDKPRIDKYIEWIQKQNSWGGAIGKLFFFFVCVQFVNKEYRACNIIFTFPNRYDAFFCDGRHVDSTQYIIEIDSIDVQTGRIDKFGEGSYDERVLIVYSGIR